MGLELVDGSLGGILRVTASTPAKRDHVHQGRISFAVTKDEDDLYGSNIQVATSMHLTPRLQSSNGRKFADFIATLSRSITALTRPTET
jgi:hypothetical protein